MRGVCTHELKEDSRTQSSPTTSDEKVLGKARFRVELVLRRPNVRSR
jgi:hypothetical protein